MNWWARHSEWNHSAAASAGAASAPGNYRYFAFLSYSHKDEAVANWLHSALEQFRVPHSLTGKLGENGVIPRRLTPVFRDRHELAAAEDLGSEIRQALAGSRFLVVLCSPAAAQSRWTNAEIDAFKRSRPDGCVIAAVVAGEPFASELPGREAEECFPPALRLRYDRRGRPTTKRAEPLAADFRDGHGDRRTGLLKIAAAMLGVGLDDLVQRDYLRRQRRLAAIAAASLGGMLVTSSLAVIALEARDTATDQRRQAEGLVGFMLGDLRDKLEPLGRLDVLDSVGSRALEYYQRQDKSELSDEALAQRSKALTLMGEVANARGDLDGALHRYREALAGTQEAVRRYPDDAARLFDHAQNVFWVGYIAYQRGQVADASNRFNEYRRLASRMVALDPGNKDYRLEEIYANSNLGTLLMDERRYAQATRAFEGSLRPAERIAAAEPQNLDYQKQLGDALAWLADAYEKSGDLEKALAQRERQIRLLSARQRQHRGDTDLQRMSMTAHRAIGRLHAARGQITQGLEQSIRGVAIAESLFEIEPDNTEWLQANAAARLELAELQLAANQPEAASASTRAACTTVDRLLQRDSTVAGWKGPMRAQCLIIRARVSHQQGALDEAVRLARQAVSAAAQSPRPLDRQVLTMLALSAGSSALDAAARRTEAVDWARKAVAAAPERSQLSPRELAELAAVELKAGNVSEARRIAARLDSIPYRHPDYLRARSAFGRT